MAWGDPIRVLSTSKAYRTNCQWPTWQPENMVTQQRRHTLLTCEDEGQHLPQSLLGPLDAEFVIADEQGDSLCHITQIRTGQQLRHGRQSPLHGFDEAASIDLVSPHSPLISDASENGGH